MTPMMKAATIRILTMGSESVSLFSSDSEINRRCCCLVNIAEDWGSPNMCCCTNNANSEPRRDLGNDLSLFRTQTYGELNDHIGLRVPELPFCGQRGDLSVTIIQEALDVSR